MQNKIATTRMRSVKILDEKITHPRLKNQIVGPLLVALHAECYNILNSCRLCRNWTRHLLIVMRGVFAAHSVVVARYVRGDSRFAGGDVLPA